MGSMSLIHWVVVVAVVLILFGGGGKISSIMGDFARGIKSFKKNMADDEFMSEAAPPAGQITPPTPSDAAFLKDAQRADEAPVDRKPG